MIGQSSALNAVRRAVEQVSTTDATVLILGETGTGKELVAQAIHARSRRADRAFVPVSGVALAPGLLASELFGHEAGAFTGAIKRRIGRFEQAHGGTLFLDEIGELPAEVQALLLRVLQERVIERVGGEAIPVDIRLLAATHRDLTSEVRTGRFRADLLYRLNVFPITLPPLRDRLDDLPQLAEHFVQVFSQRHLRTVSRIAATTLRQLAAYHWPGNIRELQNLIERAVILSEGAELAFDASWLAGASASESAQTWAAQERQRIVEALRATDGRVYGPGGAAQRLGLKPTTLYGKMRKHAITKTNGEWQ
jgi:transcriptional regulator with GAF, ATPase, and Fis domain